MAYSTIVAQEPERNIAPASALRPTQSRLTTVALILLSASLVLLLGHAFIPHEQFIHRGDDAYYYFKLAANYPETGFWTFDKIHSTNGVQPLWAIILTGFAQLLAWLGVSDAHSLARAFVALTAALNFASSLLLFHVLSRKVSIGTAIAAAGAFLFPLGIVWARVWGMENSLYALMLISTVSYFHLVFLERATDKTAFLLGLLLGLTALARLNAGIFIACLLLYFLWRKTEKPFTARLRLALVAGVAASLIIVPYLLANFYATGHLLPISGVVKAISNDSFLRNHGVSSPLSVAFIKMLYWELRSPVEWFITSRATDGLWIAGGRVVFSGQVPIETLLAVLSVFLLLPLFAGKPGLWLKFLAMRFARLSPFIYVLVFGVLNASLSTFLYPNQLRYAMTRWWLVENEIILVVLVSTLVMASVSYLANRLVPHRLHLKLATIAIVSLVAFHSQQMLRHYWSDEIVFHDWNYSWNDESYKAAEWLAENVPPEAIVGSWNAGVLGYYSKQRVVNLDGLINNRELLPYLKQNRVSDYIRKEKIAYLSDMESMFSSEKVEGELQLKEIYSSFSPLMQQHYRIYRVEE